MKSVGSEEGGMGKGVHSACWGNRATLGFRERKQFSMCGEGRGVYPSVHFISKCSSSCCGDSGGVF
jgi:hypothetical protein